MSIGKKTEVRYELYVKEIKLAIYEARGIRRKKSCQVDEDAVADMKKVETLT